jgi:hypothetical protein
MTAREFWRNSPAARTRNQKSVEAVIERNKQHAHPMQELNKKRYVELSKREVLVDESRETEQGKYRYIEAAYWENQASKDEDTKEKPGRVKLEDKQRSREIFADGVNSFNVHYQETGNSRIKEYDVRGVVSVRRMDNGLFVPRSLVPEVAAIKTVTDKVNTALESDGGAGYQFTATALENAPGGGSTIENIVVVSAAAVAAVAALDSGLITIVRHSTFRARFTVSSLAGRTGLKFTIKPDSASLGTLSDAQSLIQIDESAGLEIVNASTGGVDSSKGSITYVDDTHVDVYIDQTVTGLLLAGSRMPYSIKMLNSAGDDTEITSVDYPGGAKTLARVLNGVSQTI